MAKERYSDALYYLIMAKEYSWFFPSVMISFAKKKEKASILISFTFFKIKVFTKKRHSRSSYRGERKIFLILSSLVKPWRVRTIAYIFTWGNERRIFSSNARPTSLVAPVRSSSRSAYHSRRAILVDWPIEKESDRCIHFNRRADPNALPSLLHFWWPRISNRWGGGSIHF